MKKRFHQLLALLLAATLSFGDVIPAFAAEMTVQAEQTEDTEEPPQTDAVPSDEDTESSDPQETPVSEDTNEADDTEKTKKSDEATVSNETEEPAAQEGTSDELTVLDSDAIKVLDAWTGSIEVGPYQDKTYQFTVSDPGDYLISRPEASNVNFTDYDSWVFSIHTSEIDENTYDVISYSGTRKGSKTFTVTLYNHKDTTTTFTLLRDYDFEIPTIRSNRPYDKTIPYAAFSPEYTGVYSISADWVYCQQDGSIAGTSSEFLMTAGYTYIIRFPDYMNSISVIEMGPVINYSGTELFYMDANEYYAFTPTISGTYMTTPLPDDDDGFMGWTDCWISCTDDSNCDQWHWNKTRRYHYMEADKTYYISSTVDTALCLTRTDVTLLDYDYYNAFIASGGSVSADGTISDGTAGWTLRSIIGKLFGFLFDDDDEWNTSAFSSGNLYWNSKEGSFEASSLYKLPENAGEAPASINASDIQDNDVVLVEYRPEIVWVQSMDLSAERTTIQTGQKLQITATPDAGQDKYPFNRNPEIRFASSNSKIASVDPDTGLVTARKPGTVTITAYADEELREEEGLKDIVSASIKLTVITPGVANITITSPDENWNDGTYLIDAESVKTAAFSGNLTVTLTDTMNQPCTGKVTWKTSNSKIASVKQIGDTYTLVIPKNAVTGVAEITAASNKAKATFKVIVADMAVRQETTSLTMNSNSSEWQPLVIYPNNLLVKDMEITSIELTDPDSPFELMYTSGKGMAVSIRYKEGTIAKSGKTTVSLNITQQSAGNEAITHTDTIKIAVTNKPATPKASAKVTQKTNTFWKNTSNASYAKVLITSKMDPTDIRLNEDSSYEIVPFYGSLLEYTDKDDQWILTLRLKDSADLSTLQPKTTLSLYYDGYWNPVNLSLNLKPERKTPKFPVGSDYSSYIYYQGYTEDISIAVTTPSGMTGKDLNLTDESAKYFTVISQWPEDDSIDHGYAYITLKLKDGVTAKKAPIQFNITSDQFADADTVLRSASRMVTIRQAKDLRLTYNVNQLNYSKPAATYTFSKDQIDNELLDLYFNIDFGDIEQTADPEKWNINCSFSRGGLNAEDYQNHYTYGYKITSTDEFFSSTNPVKATFTATLKSNPSISLKPVAVTFKPQTKSSAVTIKTTVKGKLNVVDTENSDLRILSTAKNLPLGAAITNAWLDEDSAEKYDCTFRHYDNLLEISVNEGQHLPIGKDKITVYYTVTLADGSELDPTAVPVTLNLVQSASVKADKKAVTLYNASAGMEHGAYVEFTVSGIDSEEIEDITVNGLDGTGISCTSRENTLLFYVDPVKTRGLEKTYKATAVVTLPNAGTKNGKLITYQIPISVTLKK